MKSFTKKLVLHYTGIIFICFLFVYVLFNVTVRAYIRAEAEREITGGINDIMHQSATVVRAFPNDMNMVSGWRFAPIDVVQFGIPGIEFRAFDFVGELPTTQLAPDQAFDLITEFSAPHPAPDLVYMTITTPRRSILNTEVIIINHDQEILIPHLPDGDTFRQAEVQFLTDFYLAHSARFTENDMVRVTDAMVGTFYIRSAPGPIPSDAMSVLLYSDVSSAMAFMHSMNQRLAILLLLSGIASLITALMMSNRFKRTIDRLCNYAETIGHGHFHADPGVFKDSEFDQLSKSMNNMSNMLQLYEDNQKQFFENASHELRTPLMSIKGYAEGILQSVFDKDEAAQVILHEGQKMTELVSGLLYMSRLDSNGAPTAVSTVDVKNLLYDCLESVKPIANRLEKRLNLHTTPDTVIIQTDEERLERVIINILSNALRHAKDEVQINCRISDKLEITIEDDGDGINENDLPHLFKRFYKGTNGKIGLGLAICQDIVKSLGGTIVAENLPAPKSGAMFTIVLNL